MKLIDFLKFKKKELIKNRFIIEEEILVLFGAYIREFQRNTLTLKDLKEAFKIYGYEIIEFDGKNCILKDINNNLGEIIYNEQLIELMAFYGDNEAIKCMSSILDWKRTHGYEIPNEWKNIDHKWTCNQRKFKKHTIKM